MTSLRVFLSRVLDVIFRRRREARLSEEVQAHLDLLADEYVAQGMTRDEARVAARKAFGGVDRIKILYREQRGLPSIDSLIQDVRYAARLLTKDLRFTMAAVVALALGIGANTTAFTFVNATMLRQMPLERPDRLMSFTTTDLGGRPIGVSVGDFRDWRDATRAFSGVLMSYGSPMNLGDEGLPPERYWGTYISIDGFRIFGRRPILGRDFIPEDDRPDAAVAIIAHSIWKGRYGSDPNIIGRVVRVNDTPLTIIGVMPPTFHFPTTVEIWRPAGALPATLLNAKRDARSPYAQVIGRLGDGVTIAQAQAELDAIAGNLARQFPDTNGTVKTTIEPMQRALLGVLQDMFVMVMGAVAFVLLIACVNIANLLLARAAHRSREMALRFSLGATRWRVVRQLLIESLLLAVAGGIVGLGLAVYGVQVFSAAIGELMGAWQNPSDFFLEFSMDWRVYAFSALACVIATGLFGLAPALHASRASANEVLKDGGRTATGGRQARRWTEVLMVAQLALTLVLLAGGALMGRNFLAMYRAGQVTDTSGVVTMRLAITNQTYPTPERKKQFYRQLGERLASVREFTSATVASDIPFQPLLATPRQVVIQQRPLAAGEKPPSVAYFYVGPRYFETLGLQMLRGRTLDDRDERAGQEGAVVNERFASLFFPNGDTLGQRIRLVNAGIPGVPQAPEMSDTWHTIVGVSPTIPQDLNIKDPQPVVYAPVQTEPAPHRFVSVIVRSTMDRAAVVARLREEVQKVDRDLPGYWIRTLDEVLASSRWILWIFGAMFALLAGIALVLASVGLYAVTAHGVAQRAHEIGIRMALGAHASQVVWLFVQRTLWQIALGLAVGLVGALAAGQLLQTVTIHVGPRDPLTLALVAVLLVAVASLACVLPARRAARLDPVVALRDE